MGWKLTHSSLASLPLDNTRAERASTYSWKGLRQTRAAFVTCSSLLGSKTLLPRRRSLRDPTRSSCSDVNRGASMHRRCELRASLEVACQSRVRSRTTLRDRTSHARQEQASRRSRQRPRRCCDARTARPDQEAEPNAEGPALITNRSPAFSTRIRIPETIRYLKPLNFQGASKIAL